MKNVAIAILLVFSFTSAHTALAASGFRQYTNKKFGWKISYPADWQYDEQDLAYVRFSPPDGQSLCGVGVAKTRDATVDEFADRMTAFVAQDLRDRKGLQSRTLLRRRLILGDGQVAVRTKVGIEPGGRSLRTYVLTPDASFALDCETYVGFFPKIEKTFQEFSSSFQTH